MYFIRHLIELLQSSVTFVGLLATVPHFEIFAPQIIL